MLENRAYGNDKDIRPWAVIIPPYQLKSEKRYEVGMLLYYMNSLLCGTYPHIVLPVSFLVRFKFL